MNLNYVTFTRFPNEKAHAKQIKEVCNSLINHTPVTLVVPNRAVAQTATSFGLDQRVRVVRVPVFDFASAPWLGAVGWCVTVVMFVVGSAVYVAWQALRGRQPVVYTRDYFCAVLPTMCRIQTAWESHRGQWNGLIRYCAKRGVVLYVISNGLREFYLTQSIPQEQVVLVPDGVDLKQYQNLPSRFDARNQLGIQQNERIVVYTGHLYAWKGVHVLAEAAQSLSGNCRVLFVGGTAQCIADFTQRYKEVSAITVVGRNDEQVALYQKAADVVVIPNSAENEISQKYTSPLKLFEYMASGTPVVASDLPSIREVLSDDMAYYAQPDDVESLSTAINNVLHNPAQAAQRAARAQAASTKYSWDVRASKIVANLAALP